MNPRIEKLCIPRYQRDPIWKFWQSNARLEKIHPPVFWKSLDHHTQRKSHVTQSTKIDCKYPCENGCHYTTLTYKYPPERLFNEKGFRIFIDFEHFGLGHTTWKESIKREHRWNRKKKQSLNTKIARVNVTSRSQSLDEEYLRRQELTRYVRSHAEKEDLFRLDRTPYPNRPIPMSRRPQDALHIDFHQAACFEGSKVEATFKTFFHRKYLLKQHLREHILKDFIKTALNTELKIEIIGHFILHPNELSKHEIKMFDLTSTFGDLYEGHVIRINNDKLILLLASVHHSHVKFAQVDTDPPDNTVHTSQRSTLEQIVLEHVHEYFQTHHDSSIDEIRRVQIELESLTDKHRVIVHLLTDDENLEDLTFEITQEQEPRLFDADFQQELYFLQGINERHILHSVQHKLEELFAKRYSPQHHDTYSQLASNMERDTIDSLRKMFHAYVNNFFSAYSREESMRIAIQYHFDDLLDKLDANGSQSISSEQMQTIMDDIRIRLRLQIDHRLKAEETAKILLIGPPMKKDTHSLVKEVMIHDHHREIFIARSNSHTGPIKLKDTHRHESGVIVHEEIDGGPSSFDRLPMSTDSLTIVTRRQQRKHLVDAQQDSSMILLGNSSHSKISPKENQAHPSFPVACNQEQRKKKLTSHDFETDNHSLETLDTASINTKSYNTSAQAEKMYQQRIKRRASRSPAEYGKHKVKRKRHSRYQRTPKASTNIGNMRCSFLKNLFLLRDKSNHQQLPPSADTNFNAIKKYSIADSTERLLSKNWFIFETSVLEINIGWNSSSPIFDLIIQKIVFGFIILFYRLVSNKLIYDELPMISSINEEGPIDHKINDKYSEYNKLEESEASIEEIDIQNEGFQDKEDFDDDDFEDSEQYYDGEDYLSSLYGSLSSVMTQVHRMYESKPAQLIASLDLAHSFINFLHMKKDRAHEVASAIINARQHLLRNPQQYTTASNTMNYEDDVSVADDRSISSGVISIENSDITLSEEDSTVNDDDDIFTSDNRSRNLHNSNSQCIMNRISTYLSNVDWRIFNYITKTFLQNGTPITSHALEFCTALLLDLIEDSVFQTYFHLKWCVDYCNDSETKQHIETIFIEEFLKKSLENLFHRLQLINSQLLENIALMHVLKKYTTENLLQELNSTEYQPSPPIGYNPCVWFSTNILIKTICLLTNDLFDQMSDDYLADYTKFEYLLVSYFHKIDIIHDLGDFIEKNVSQALPDTRCLLHVIDLNQAPKFFSDHAFKRFHLGNEEQLNGNIEALKDLVLLDIPKRNIKSVEKSYIPLSVNDLIERRHLRVLNPSPWILAQYKRRWNAQKSPTGKDNVQEDSYQFNEDDKTAKMNNLPVEVRMMLVDMIKKYGTVENSVATQSTHDYYDGLSEEDVARLVQDAVEAVEKFDRENNIGERKLQNKKTINDRLTEFFKYSGQRGVRLLDDVLKIAKLRSNDPKKYIPLAVSILKGRLNQHGSSQKSKQTIRFIHTLETLLTAADGDPEMMTRIVRKKTEEKKSLKSEEILSTNMMDQQRQTMPIINETMESKHLLQESVDDPNRDHSVEMGLSIAQLVVLATLPGRMPLKLTSFQLEQICLKQNLTMDAPGLYLERLMRTIEIPERFQLTEEQLVQIAIEDSIQFTDDNFNEASYENILLTENQIQCLIYQNDLVNTSTNRELRLPLVLNLHQLIELCSLQKIELDLKHKPFLPTLSPVSLNDPKLKFCLSPVQLTHLINKNHLNMEQLSIIERNMKKEQQTQSRQFRLNEPQLAYLFHNRRVSQNRTTDGLSASQFIALYLLNQSSLTLMHQQIEQLARMQNMSLDHLRTLSPSEKLLQLSYYQLLQITLENQITPTQILSHQNIEKTKVLTIAQLCSLISQHDQLISLQNVINHTLPRIYLNAHQVFSLIQQANISLDQLTICSTDLSDTTDLRFEPEQLVTLWQGSNISFDELEYTESLSDIRSQFILTDEQFSILLSSTTTLRLSAEVNESVSNIPAVRNRLSISFHNELATMYARLQSSLEAQTAAVKVVSDSLVKHNQLENILNLINEVSLRSIDSISTKTETIPSFILDLLKLNTVTEDTYQTIKHEATAADTVDDSNKAIIESIQVHQLTLPQIQKLQRHLLTPKLIDALRFGHLSERILDAYKSQSPLQMIKNVQTIAGQLKTLSYYRAPSISQLDSSLRSIERQATSENTISNGNVQPESNVTVDQTKQSDPIALYPESIVDRQQILQELSERLKTQLLELKKEYGLEPTKGNSSICDIINELQTKPVAEDIKRLLGRPIDEVDVLNVFNGHSNNLFDQSFADINKTKQLIEDNIQHRLSRINERIQMLHLWQQHIENNRLNRPMNLEEYTAIVFENIPQFEQLTNLQLTVNDFRVIFMNRFASLERVMARPLTELEYRQLFQANSCIEYFEKELFHRSLTNDEYTEQEDLMFLPYRGILSISSKNVWESLKQQNINPSYEQLEEVLRKRAELIDQYEIMHLITPSIKVIEDQLGRPLTLDEKKRLVHNDYSIIQKIREFQSSIEESSPITTPVLYLAQNTQKTSFVENLERLQTDLAHSLTKEEIEMLVNGDVVELEKKLEKSIPRETIKSLYDDRFVTLTSELQRHLTENEIRDILIGHFSDIEQELGRQLTPAERQAYKASGPPRSTLTDGQLTHAATDDFENNLTPTQDQENELRKNLVLNSKGSDRLHTLDSEDNFSIFGFISTQPTTYSSTEIESNLTFEELTKRAGDRYGELTAILQRSLTQEELNDLLFGKYGRISETINNILDKQKEEELRQLSIKRLQFFEHILHRQLSRDELLRFAEDRFQLVLRLFTGRIESEHIRDLASGHYDKIEPILEHSLTLEEKYHLQRNILQAHVKYANVLDELEYILQRKLNEQELITLLDAQYKTIEKRFDTLLTDEQMRNILSGEYDSSLAEFEDVLKRWRIQYDDNYKRTRRITARLIEQLDQRRLDASKPVTSTQQKVLDIENIDQTSADLPKNREKSLSQSDISVDQIEREKAFETPVRVVEHVADKEHIEDISTITDAINKFRERSAKKDEKFINNQTTLAWLSDLTNELASLQQPVMKSNDNKLSIAQQRTVHSHTDEDLYLGWTLFKSASYPELGLREERPLMINVKHKAQTYVVGIPEQYADDQSQIIANRIYRGESIFDRLPTPRIIKTMGEFVSQLFHIPIINDATHFIVPSRAYEDIIEPLITYESEIVNMENDQTQMCDSPETLEWYEECIQRNVQVHAQIPSGYQPSIVYCHTGRRIVLTPAKRAEYRNMSFADQSESIVPDADQATFEHDFLEPFDQPTFDNQSADSSSTTQTVTELIMNTMASSQKTNLLEALDELFSQENLDKHPMSKTHWQEIFLIVLNSYLHSNLSNRKDIFKRLSDKLHELRRKERQRSSGLYPSISIASPSAVPTTTELNDTDMEEHEQQSFHFGLRSSFNSMHSNHSPNDSEVSGTPITSEQPSVTSHDTLPLLSNHASSIRSFSQNQSTGVLLHKISVHCQTSSTRISSKSVRHLTNSLVDDKQPRPVERRRYKITVVHTDESISSSANQPKPVAKPIKLPPISPKNKSSDKKRARSIFFNTSHRQSLPLVSIPKQTRTNSSIEKEFISRFV
ncbi:unnamed protein product [Adineta ricciae]|uniref:EF-hand domain-containing protein n=1 Tax=Adineta ricciae TaxID=249248 RepID=A0A813YSI3_ADIRI|nr:unnamed protein product [Adineta ricciae]